MVKQMIRRVLIANRGEIACRVQRACKALGVESVCIASEADAKALFAREAERLVIIGPAAAKDSYLAVDKIIAAAKAEKCDAVHPGYGFLSENAEFAQKVVDAGLIFIGPDPEMIRALGSKTSAREKVTQYGVPVTPGSAGGLDDEAIAQAALEMGFPVIIKAVAGGGGRGMRVAQDEKSLRELLPRARAEAKKNFASEDVYIERYIVNPRHVEVQIFGDGKGTVLHFGTRDCSTQRRHQKLIEEAPAPGLSDGLREKIHQAAVNAGKSVNYKNAGTAEFLVSGDELFFLEMNTRIQVEHPVTEAVTGVDLVELQLRIAGGEALPLRQEDISFNGHAIEFRIYAEDPAQNFRPSVGRISHLRRPSASYIREDYGAEEGDEITPHYDAMISKLIISAPTRSEAIARADQALREYEIGGLQSTVEFHRWMLANRDFRRGPIDISYVEREFTPEALQEFAARQIRDPRHQGAIAGAAELKSLFEYKSERFRTIYTIEVVHKKEGFFLATPIDARGKRAPKKNCRMSNGLNTVVQSLIAEVLDELPPSELFR